MKSVKVGTVDTVMRASVMAHKTLKDQLRFHYQFYLLMNTVGRTEEAKRSLQKLEGVIEGIRPEIKAVNIDNLKQSAK